MRWHKIPDPFKCYALVDIKFKFIQCSGKIASKRRVSITWFLLDCQVSEGSGGLCCSQG